MSFRTEEKILVSDNNDFLVKNFLKSNLAKKLYKPTKSALTLYGKLSV